MKKKPKTPAYLKKSNKDYEERNNYKQFNRRATPEEYDKLIAYWKELIASRHKQDNFESAIVEESRSDG